MNKLKIIIAVLAVMSLMFGQCACPYGGSPSTWSETLHYLITGSNSNSNSVYDFSENGELTITSKETKAVRNVFWSSEGEEIALIFEKDVKVYSFEKISEIGRAHV